MPLIGCKQRRPGKSAFPPRNLKSNRVRLRQTVVDQQAGLQEITAQKAVDWLSREVRGRYRQKSQELGIFGVMNVDGNVVGWLLNRDGAGCWGQNINSSGRRESQRRNGCLVHRAVRSPGVDQEKQRNRRGRRDPAVCSAWYRGVLTPM